MKIFKILTLSVVNSWLLIYGRFLNTVNLNKYAGEKTRLLLLLCVTELGLIKSLLLDRRSRSPSYVLPSELPILSPNLKATLELLANILDATVLFKPVLHIRILIHIIKLKKLKIALYQSQREIHTVATRVAPGDLGLKSHPKDYQQKFTY